MADGNASDERRPNDTPESGEPRAPGNGAAKSENEDRDAISAETGPAIDVDSAHDRAS